MNAKSKFLLGAFLLVGTVGYLMATGIKDTGVYFVTPSELAARIAAKPSFRDVGVKMGAKVVKGSIERDIGTQTVRFKVTDGKQEYPVVYRGLPPDTFTDGVEVVVEGRLDANGVFHATSLLAKCGSRYETVPKA
ncbi:MAG TPA: cytochrome c maturation protein CcmE [Gemmatimonadales bacterium]|nr:cytochrome c maturation protein CcmE [Gemmatimonadales bacterium]